MPHGRAAPRRTLARTASCRGVSLFLGAPSSIVIKPRESVGGGGGIGFRRVDVAGSPEIAALAANVAPENRRTVLATPGGAASSGVQTVEHLMSALAGLGITDALVEVSGPELPIGDGSALPFAQAIQEAGVRDLAAAGGQQQPLIIREPISIVDDKSGAKIEALPHDEPGLRMTYNLAYPPGAPIPPQSATLFVPFGQPVDGYIKDVAPARTFSLQQEAEMARAMGLFKHLSPKDMLVIGAQGPIDNAYRFDNEPARHKLLDALGDLALSGLLARGIQAHVVCTRTGHAQNHAMAKALAALAAAG